MANKTIRMLLAALLLWGVSACDKTTDGEDCIPGVSIEDVEGNVVTMIGNQRIELVADLELCTDDQEDQLGWQFEWRYDLDGNGLIEAAEEEPVSFARNFSLIACFNEVGDHALQLKAIPITDTTASEMVGDYTVTVETPTERVERSQCVQDGIDALKAIGEVVKPADYTPFSQAASCMIEYSQENVCDFEAAYATSIVALINLGATFQDRFENRSALTPADVQAIFDDEIVPMVDAMLAVESKAEDDFTFVIKGYPARVKMFGDITYLEGDESVYLNIGGEHDKADTHAFASVIHMVKGFMDMFLAYDGLVQWAIDIPRLDTIDYLYPRRAIIEGIEGDPEFMTLAGTDGKEGADHLLSARGEFMDAIISLRKAMQSVQGETDSQYDDLFRYWDCGEDGICDCTSPAGLRENVNLVCPNDPAAWEKADAGEGNNKYDEGETIGSDRLENPDVEAQKIDGASLEDFDNFLVLILENLRGPDALDYDEIFTGANNLIRDFALLPYPELRLSEWFLTPTDIRSVVPLYSISAGDFLFDLEAEAFRDTGYDGKTNEQEKTIASRNPRDLDPADFGYDKLLNPDPAWDDFSPFCNPWCNWTDGVDNDGDGGSDQKAWSTDPVDLGNQDADKFSFAFDLGTENNFVFDFVDENDNLRHDEGEKSEPFDDTGVVDFNGNSVSRKGAWDRADRGHEWPTGSDVGPVQIDQYDPANGIAEDLASGTPSDRNHRLTFATGDLPQGYMYEGLFDNYYLFFQDPTFSGVLQFPDDIKSIEGGSLTDNAKLMRFFNKALELAEILGFREGNAHTCQVDSCND